MENGYGGLLEGRLEPVDRTRLGGLMRRGGTLLGTDRSKEVETDEGRKRAVRRLEEAGVGGLVVISGGGSLTAARALHEAGVRTVGIPATIDNDVPGTELAVGVDTAVATAVEAALIPEFEARSEDLVRFMERAYEGGRSHFIVAAAEGAGLPAEELQEYINNTEGTYEADLTAVGHIQSGGDPTPTDRILAARLGAAAVEALAEEESGMMIGARGEKTERIPLSTVVGEERPLDPAAYRLAQILAEMPG